jgi:hypothetical protein
MQVVVTDYTFIPKVLGSKPGQDKDHPDEYNHGFP